MGAKFALKIRSDTVGVNGLQFEYNIGLTQNDKIVLVGDQDNAEMPQGATGRCVLLLAGAVFALDQCDVVTLRKRELSNNVSTSCLKQEWNGPNLIFKYIID